MARPSEDHADARAPRPAGASVADLAASLRTGLGVDGAPSIELALAAASGAHYATLPVPTEDERGFGGRRAIALRIVEARRRAAGSGRHAGIVVIEVRPTGALEQSDPELSHLVEHRLAGSLRHTGRDGGIADAVGRWDADAYCALVSDLPDADALRVVAARLADAVRRSPVTLADGGHVAISACVGAALDDDDDVSLETLVERARAAAGEAVIAGDGSVRLAPAADATSEGLRVAQALALITSAREGVPALHCQQVADLARAIATELAAPPEIVARGYLGGWLHDVGKVAIPDAIVGKPGRLTEVERDTMRMHAEIGDALVARVSSIAGAHLAVRSHHERWNGTGYPQGLAGEAIPLEARIVATADTYSAITSERVYSAERSREEAIEELRRSSGTHLDPAVVEALVRALERIDRELRHLLSV